MLRKTVGAVVETFTDTIGIQPSTIYTYRVRAYSGSTYSAYSNELEVTTPAYSAGDETCE